MEDLFKGVENIRHNIQGIHLWGKRESENGRRVAHIGDLNSFLKMMYRTFNDDVDRYFVP